MIWTLICFGIAFFVLAQVRLRPDPEDDRRAPRADPERGRRGGQRPQRGARAARAAPRADRPGAQESAEILAEARKVADAQIARAKQEAEADRQRRLEETTQADRGRDRARDRPDPHRGRRPHPRGDPARRRQGARHRGPAPADRGGGRGARLLRARGATELVAVAHRMYANALYEAAQEQGSVDAVREQLARACARARGHARARGVPREPAARPGAKADVLDEVTTGADPVVRNFVRLAAAKGRAGASRGDRRGVRGDRRSRSRAASRSS